MSEVSDFRALLAPKQNPVFTGTVTGLGLAGQVSVKSGPKVVSCFSTLALAVGDKVRVQGLIVVAKINQTSSATPLFRV